MTRVRNVAVESDGSEKKLVELVERFSVKRAVEWLRIKFPSFDTSKGEELACDATKNEKDYFAVAELLGYVTKLPLGGTRSAASTDDNKPLLVAAVKMRKDLTERTSRLVQFNYAKKLLQNAITKGAQGVSGLPSQGLFFFYDKDGFFRLSLVTGEVEKRRFKYNEAKRQSFYIEPLAANNIVKRRLSPPIKTFAELKEVFSVEQLTKEFYTKLFDWYTWALSPKVNVSFPNDLDDDTDDRKYNNEAIIRMITRLMFTWFIRQRKLVPDVLFDRVGLKDVLKRFEPTSMEQDNYYRAILQNLFFATFNCQPEKRRFIHTFIGRSDERHVTTLYRYEREFRDVDSFRQLMRKVPFLNCALFDCLDKIERPEDGGRSLYFDGFSGQGRKYQAFVPNGLFFDDERGIINLFNLYEFTVNENNADDSDVALDPELLGKVFENLLGAFNPETQETARNATGSFYTPREIVDYMVEESLKNYLKTKVPAADDARLDDLFDRNKAADGADTMFSGKEREEILDALYGCKILDPACGSGAFPMGILHCMVRLLTRLDPQCVSIREHLLSRYKEDKALVDPTETADERKERLEELESRLKEGQHYPDYERKLYLIENCIYGVDIQPIATQISKLRFFISLLCDQLRSSYDPDAENFGLLSLPNLEAKFVCANTLISLPDLKQELPWEDIAELRNSLQDNRHDIFRARSTKTKEKYKAKDLEIRDAIRATVRDSLAKPDEDVIAKCREQIADAKKRREAVAEPDWYEEDIQVQADLFAAFEKKRVKKDRNEPQRKRIDAEIDWAENMVKKELAKADKANVSAATRYADMVAGWDPYDQNASSPFFDPEWMFNNKEGFDVVIGNPPYVQLQANGGELAKMYQGCGYKTFDRTGDLYCLFYERGFELSSHAGTLCYITSNKWMRAGYGQMLRKYFAEKTDPLLLIDFAGEKIFESASVDTNILLLGHGVNKGNTISVIATAECRTGLDRFVGECASANSYQTDEPWLILSAGEKNLSESLKKGVPLGELGIQIYRGVLSGLNEVFNIDEETRDEILNRCADSAERQRTKKIFKPLVRGRDIARYGKNWAGLFLVGMHNGIGDSVREQISHYPSLKRFMDRYKTELSNRSDKGDTPYNLRDCAYWKEFGKPKLIWADIMRVRRGEAQRFPRFSYCDEGYYANNSCYIAVGENLKYILGILNSTVGRYQCYKEIVVLDNGGFRMWKEPVERLRIAKATPAQQQPIVALVDRILTAKKTDPNADTSALESQIDQLVYKLYGLTEEEIAIVEGRGESGAAGVRALPEGDGHAGRMTLPDDGVAKARRRGVRVPVAAVEALHSDDDEELE